MLICFTGVDGSGKSTQARRLVDRLTAAGYPAVHVWGGGRTRLSGSLIRLIKRRLLARPAARWPTSLDRAYGAGHYERYIHATRRILRHPPVLYCWLQLSLVEHMLRIWRVVLPPLLQGHIVVCDRYLCDSYVNAAVLAGLQVPQFCRLLDLPVLACVPAADHSFFCSLPAPVAYSRKADVIDISYLERRIPLYRAAASRLGMQTIDATAAPEAIELIVWQSVQPLLAAGQRQRAAPP